MPQLSTVQCIELLVAINLLAVGLSHFLQSKVWISFFQDLTKKGSTGNLINGMLALGFGSLVLAFHFIWNWPQLLVTLYGLLLTIRGLLYLCIPSLGLKSIASVNETSGNKFRVAGFIMIVFACWIFYLLSTTI